MNIGDRLRIVRKELGLTMEAMGEQISTSQGHISAMEKGTKVISGRTIDLICMRFHVRKEWLTDGTGEMFADMTKDEEIAAFMGDALSNEDDTFQKRFLSMLSRLSIEEWALLEKKAKELAAENKGGAD